ncbi:MAG: hypothetical protein H0T80_04845 [Betaproteobacteria bacterium]|nr:hypothetical protein [Betaproteobacteria bacterium]
MKSALDYEIRRTVRSDSWVIQAGLVVSSILAAGAIAALRRQDANWDLKNYHFYNAWAFVHDRMGWDLAPAQLQTYFNPLLDLPFYWMVAANWPPRAIAFVMGMPAGIGAFFAVKVLFLLFRNLPLRERRNYVMFAFVIGILAANPLSLLASTMNEWQGSALTMVALWLLLRCPDAAASHWPMVMGAGFICGAASGLKLTAATFAVGLCVALVARRPDLWRGLREACVFGLGVLTGMAMTLGFWLRTLQAHFDNPLFPFYNEWFESPWWDVAPLLVRSFGPQSPLEWLFFPLLLFGNTAELVATSGFRDWRLPVLFLAAIAAATAWAIRRRRRLPMPMTPGPVDAWRFVAIFWVASYVVWLALHAIYRYIIPLELLSGALLLYCLRWTFSQRRLNTGIVVVSLVVIATIRYPVWGRVDYGERFFRVDIPPVAPHSLVLLINDEPMAHVLPFFPADGRFVGAKSNFINPQQTNAMAQEMARVIRAHDGPLYALSFPSGSNEDVLAAHRLQRAADGCSPLVTNMLPRPLELCRLQRLPQG